jgi:hypothetical protein
VTPKPAEFSEETAHPRVESVPLSHLSIEVGHLYSEDYERSDEALVEYFRRIAAWSQAVRRLHAETLRPVRPRISTCFLVDDYFGNIAGPSELITRIEALAKRADLTIDYLARESSCANGSGHQPARLMESRIVAEPSPGDNGVRPAMTVSGWLSNGQRSPSTSGGNPAMAVRPGWKPPRENAANAHSIFADIQLWSEDDGQRLWSCAFLASVWQLLRLGLLRDNGTAMHQPVGRLPSLPDRWDEMPPVMRLSERAAPFCAYRAMSIMDSRFLHVEHAVRTVLGQVNVEPVVADQLRERVEAENLPHSPEAVDRLEYVFTAGVRGG